MIKDITKKRLEEHTDVFADIFNALVFNGKEVIGAIGRRKIDSIGGNALNPIYVISKEPYELRFCPSEFGVRVFKTKEEAEAKLREMEVGEW